MSNLAASATQIAGQAFVRTASAIAINTATSYISRAFDTRNFQGPRLESFHLQTSRDGAPMARVFGRVRLAGQVIWASHVREISTEEPVGGKGGGPTQTNYNYRISFAVGLCAGEITSVERIWANGAPLETAGLDMRVYTGSGTQEADPIITATEGGAVPAFRGTAYVVFEDFPLDDYGNRLPQLNFEVVRAGKSGGDERLESLVQSVNLLPGSGEFAYATRLVEESIRPGQTRPLNMNNLSGRADIELALDQLQSQLPNCQNVSIISSWFGSSLDIATCEIRPGVERRIRNIRNVNWQVGRDNRGSAYVVSTDDEDRPNFGGTPSDDSLIQAIQAIKARGMSVTLYPFIMVDAPGFPWRGRMTGQAPDVNDFFGGAAVSDFNIGEGATNHFTGDYGFRNFILTHANLARRAGGVDRFVIGSEMVGLSTIRDDQNNFPAVTELARLAGDVRDMIGPDTGLTYAADWSEYFGFHPQDGSGDIFFHLDELWSHPAISAIGIDAYFPLSDWRDGEHLDGRNHPSIYDPDYLSANIEGGEGYDWYYASTADRDHQNRQPISGWIYRYKDLRNWWMNAHRNRVSGQELSPTNWVPESKPFWLTEVGCPAVRFGANQPNVFSDGKSTESNYPYYSDGSSDNLIQRHYLEALLKYWSDPEKNSVSSVTSERMIDTSAISVWAWDARPYPDFPVRDKIWSDGKNWQLGHWINGRVGAVLLRDVIHEISFDAGLENIDYAGLNGLISGYVIDRPMRARDALSPLLSAYDIVAAETGGQVRFFTASSPAVKTLQIDRMIEQEGGPIAFSIEENMSSLRDVRVTYIDAGHDYQMGTFSTRNDLAETIRVSDLQIPLVLDSAQARIIAERRLAQSEPARRTARFSVASKEGEGLFPGAIMSLPDVSGNWQISALHHGHQTDVDLIHLPDEIGQPIMSIAQPLSLPNPNWVSEAVAFGFDLPGTDGLQAGVMLDPFRTTTVSAAGGSAVVRSAVKIGALLSTMPRGPITVWDRRTAIDIWMPQESLFSKTESETLSGANRFAVETASGWEVFGAANVTLIGSQTYRLSRLLRGLNNSDDNMDNVIASGARILVLDAGLASLDISPDFIGQRIDVSAETAGRVGVSAAIDYQAAHLRPLSVVHLKANAAEGETRLSWIPRTLDDSGSVDPSALFRIMWPTGEKTVSGTTAQVPVMMGSDTLISVIPLHPLTLPGRSAEIRV